MKLENKNKKLIAEIEIRFGLKIYKIEVTSQFRWIFVAIIMLIKILFELIEP